jgi:chromosome segregation ATPase
MDRSDLPQDAPSRPSCPGKIEVPTDKEKEALAAMKSIKERVRELKKLLASLNTSNSDENPREIVELKEELGRLKSEWNKWEEKRERAAKERMILLGHEEVN